MNLKFLKLKKRVTHKSVLKEELSRFGKTDLELKQCIIMIDNELLEITPVIFEGDLDGELKLRYNYLLEMRVKFHDAIKDSVDLDISKIQALHELETEGTDWFKYLALGINVALVLVTIKHEEFGVISSKMFAPMVAQVFKRV